MLLKNNAARLITINGKFDKGQRIESYRVLPGNNPAVEVPDELCKSVFVKSLIESGDLVEVKAGADEKTEEPTKVEEPAKNEKK